MTEISFIVKLMTSYSLPEDAKAACLARIGEVEEKLQRPITHQQQMNTQVVAQHYSPRLPQPQQEVPLPVAVARTVEDVTISTGPGTKGKRKW